MKTSCKFKIVKPFCSSEENKAKDISDVSRVQITNQNTHKGNNNRGPS